MTDRGTQRAAGPYCGLCGKPANGETHDGGGLPPSDTHLKCARLLMLEPPRFCVACGRRQKVQVSPQGWWASCSRHGMTVSG